MKKYHYDPKLRKRRVLSHEDYTVYSVNGLTVRNAAQPDEEFGNYAMHEEFPNLIPKGEIWISEKLAAKEGIFFIAAALTRLKRQAAGATERAYDDSLEVERALREKINGVEFRDGKPHKQVPAAIYLEEYVTLPDPQGPVRVWLIDGNLARSYYKTDYTEGGHGYVYPWVPRPEIWIEDGVDRREAPLIVCHEYTERRLMRDEGLDYDTAHAICSKVEFDLRKARGATPLLTTGRRKLHKKDLPRLTSDEVFRYVLRNPARNGWGHTMPSASLLRWRNDRMPRLAEVEVQCAASLALVPPQPNLVDENLRGYVLLLSAHFQGFCRDLYTECAQIIVSKVRTTLQVLIQAQFTAHRKLDHGNPNVANLREDFERFDFTLDLGAADPANPARLTDLGALNRWRNVAAHHGTIPTGTPLDLPSLRVWRGSCDGLATSLDGIMYSELRRILKRAPWAP